MRPLSGRARAAGIAAMASGLIGTSLLGAGAFAVDSPSGPACPDGAVLYAPAAGSAEAQTDPFVTAGSPDPDSFLCIANGQVVATATPTPTFTPTPTPTPAPTPTPTPTPEPLQPAPGMIGLPGSIPSDVPSDVPTDAPSPAAPSDVPSDSGPGDQPGQGGTVVQPGPVDPGPPDLSGSITRDLVISRAVSWVLQGVPYSQTSWWSDANGTYRQDCSGYVSMAWKLDQRTNYWTGNLATVSHRIATSSLKMGDVLLLPRSHVVIFAGWANAEKTKFHLFEEYSRGKPARYLTGADLSYYTGRGYGAYRYDRIADVAPGKPGGQRTISLAATSVALDDLKPVAWSQSRADEADAQEYAPPTVEDAVTPDAVPELPLETLVDAQRATDLRATDVPAETGAGTALIAAGLGLLFLAFPLAGAARAGVWTRQYGSPEQQP